jgi:hypothetical protein
MAITPTGVMYTQYGSEARSTLIDTYGWSFTGDISITEFTKRTDLGTLSWKQIVMSNDGIKLAAVAYGDRLYISSNSGNSWTQTSAGTTVQNWNGLTLSTNGDDTHLAACVNGGTIYTSDDGGSTWTNHTSSGTRNWKSVAMSDDATKLVACVDGGYIYKSGDSGTTWTQDTTVSGGTTQLWSSISSNSDGTKLIASINGGALYTSSDSGTTWTSRDSSRNWTYAEFATDNTYAVACVSGGYIYVSDDYGTTWVEKNTSGLKTWTSVSASNNASILIATDNGGHIYVSTNSGTTWIAKEFVNSWSSSAISSDGSLMTATVNGGYIYSSSDYGASCIAKDTQVLTVLNGLECECAVQNLTPKHFIKLKSGELKTIKHVVYNQFPFGKIFKRVTEIPADSIFKNIPSRDTFVLNNHGILLDSDKFDQSKNRKYTGYETKVGGLCKLVAAHCKF